MLMGYSRLFQEDSSLQFSESDWLVWEFIEQLCTRKFLRLLAQNHTFRILFLDLTVCAVCVRVCVRVCDVCVVCVCSCV